MTNYTTLSNDRLDTAIVNTTDERILEELLNERSRRVQATLEANLAAEQQYMETGEWPTDEDPGIQLVKVRNLTPLQVYRCEDEYTCIEDLQHDHWNVRRTVIETTQRMVEALYSRICCLDLEEISSYGYDTTESESDMVRRAALVSRESLSYKLAKAAGLDYYAQNHKAILNNAKKASREEIRKAV